MKKIIAIGDTHGRDFWKRVVDKEGTDVKYVFIGDYFDCYDKTPQEQADNFLDILEFARQNDVELLLGNHDHHYLWSLEEWCTPCSGFQRASVAYYRAILQQAVEEKLVKIAFKHDDYLFTHAGVTRTWFDNLTTPESIYKYASLADYLNDLYFTKPKEFEYNTLDGSGYGNSKWQGPIWVRPEALVPNALLNVHHVVGHTTMRNGVTEISMKAFQNDKKVYCIDAQGKGQYISLTDKHGIRIHRIVNKKPKNGV
jgi:hypothetical protein